MQLTIVKNDGTVIVGGQVKTLDLSSYASLDGLRAVQWDGDRGYVEYDNSKITKQDEFKANEQIDSIAQFADVIQAWNAKEA